MQRDRYTEICIKWKTEGEVEDKVEAVKGRKKRTLLVLLLQKTREVPREVPREQPQRKGLQPNEWPPDNHSVIQYFSKFGPPTLADLPILYYLSKLFIMNTNK